MTDYTLVIRADTPKAVKDLLKLVFPQEDAAFEVLAISPALNKPEPDRVYNVMIVAPRGGISRVRWRDKTLQQHAEINPDFIYLVAEKEE